MALVDPQITARCMEILRTAMRAEIGVAVPTNNQHQLGNVLAEIRKESGDPRLQELRIFRPANGEIYVCKREVDLD